MLFMTSDYRYSYPIRDQYSDRVCGAWTVVLAVGMVRHGPMCHDAHPHVGMHVGAWPYLLRSVNQVQDSFPI